jgi:hypothetical protein
MIFLILFYYTIYIKIFKINNIKRLLFKYLNSMVILLDVVIYVIKIKYKIFLLLIN